MRAKKVGDIIIWHQCALRIYEQAQAFPQYKAFGLVSQIRGSAASVPANCSEVFKRKGTADELEFFYISHGSLEEV